MPYVALLYAEKNSGDAMINDENPSENEGNHHVQCYLRTTTKKRKIQVVRMLQSILPPETAHWISVVPSPNLAALRDYCSKGSNIVRSEDFSNPYERSLQDSVLNEEQKEALNALEKVNSRQIVFWSDVKGCSPANHI